ncbi:MAG: tetratricopeptide repeat protein [Promethearchaeota archaeon]|nr:MAG: tetratricopeptide repeat protein [Candidatus Lokiarchaeota archaeon]
MNKCFFPLKKIMSTLNKDLKKAEALMNEGKDYDAIFILNKLIDKPTLSISDEILLSSLLIRLGNWESAYKVAEQSYERNQRSQDHLHLIMVILNMAYALIIIGDLDKSSMLLGESEVVYNLISKDELVVSKEIEAYKAYINGTFSFFQGNKENALKYMRRSFELYQKSGNKRAIADSLIGLANYYRIIEMDFEKALYYTNQGITTIEGIYYQRLMATAQFYLGHIYHVKGDLEKALSFYKLALPYFEKTKNHNLYLGILNNMALSYRARGNLGEAIELLTKCINLSEILKNNWIKVGYNVSMVEVLLDKGDVEKAKEYSDKVKQLRDIEKTPYINRDYKYIKALILKKSPRVQNRAKAENLLRSLFQDEDAVFEIKIESLIHVCDLLLDELKLTGEIEIIQEINPLINQLLFLTKKAHSYWYYTETYVLQAKLALLTLDIKKARQLLTKAQNIAEDYGFYPLAKKISTEHDELLQKLDLWEKLKDSESSFSDRLNLSNIDEQIKQMIHKRRNVIPEIIEEEPVMIIIISEGGIPTFSKLFTDTFVVEDDLISGFLSAFNTFSGELFSKGLDRASFGEFTLIMKPISGFLVCYIFKGQSFLAQKRIQYFIDNLKSNLELLNKFNEYSALNRIIELKDFPILNSILKESFHNKDF